MKLNKGEVRVLAFLLEKRERITLGRLAETLGIKKSNASKYVKKLEKYRLVTVSRLGRTKEISGLFIHFLNFTKAKEKLPHIKLEDLLVGKTPHFLAYLYWYVRKQLGERNKISFKISDINIPAITTRRLLTKLSTLGIVYQPSKGLYSTRKEAYETLKFCSEFLTEIYLAEAEEELKGVVGIRISFGNPEKAECIFITDSENQPGNYWPTAYTALGEYGIKLIGGGKYYYSNIRPKIADVVIHMLAVYRDARSIMYVCALLIKYPSESRKLYKKENRFGISDGFISELIEFIETKGHKTPEGFPNWEEVESMIKDYRLVAVTAHG